MTGIVYLCFFATAVASVLVFPLSANLGSVPTDAAATSSNIVNHRTLYELSVALGLISTALYVLLAGLFYVLFRPVSRSFAVLAAFFQLVGNAITALGTIFQLAPPL